MPIEIACYPSTFTAYRITFTLLFIYIISFLDRNVLALVGPEIQRDLGLNDAMMSMLYGPAYAVCYAIGGIPFGWAADRYSRRKVIFFGLAFWSLSTAVCGAARSFGQMFVARAGVGAGEAALLPAGYSILGDLFPRHRLSLPMAIFGLGAKVGYGAAFLVGALLTSIIAPGGVFHFPLLGSVFGWQAILILVGVTGLALGLSVFTFPEPQRRETVKSSDVGGYREYLRFVIRNRSFFIPHHLATAAAVALMVSIVSWMPTLMHRVYGWDVSKAGLSLGLTLIVSPTLGLPIGGWLADRWYQSGRRDAHLRLTGYTMLVGVPVAICAFTVPIAWMTVTCLAALLFVTSCYAALPPTAMQLVVPDQFRAKAASGVLLVGGFVGAIAGPVLVGGVTDYLGDPQAIRWSMLIVTAGSCLIAATLYLLAMPAMRRLVLPSARTV